MNKLLKTDKLNSEFLRSINTQQLLRTFIMDSNQLLHTMYKMAIRCDVIQSQASFVFATICSYPDASGHAHVWMAELFFARGPMTESSV
jgi:hypothetical protein